MGAALGEDCSVIDWGRGVRTSTDPITGASKGSGNSPYIYPVMMSHPMG